MATPRSAAAFRRRCREVSEELLEELVVRRYDLTPRELLAAFEAVSDRCGRLPADRLANADLAWTRAALDAVASDALTAEQKQGAVDAYHAGRIETLGETDDE